MSPAAAARRRRQIAAHDRLLRLSVAFAEAGRDLREQAAPLLAAGRPDLAAGYLDEAEVFESAITPPGAL